MVTKNEIYRVTVSEDSKAESPGWPWHWRRRRRRSNYLGAPL